MAVSCNSGANTTLNFHSIKLRGCKFQKETLRAARTTQKTKRSMALGPGAMSHREGILSDLNNIYLSFSERTLHVPLPWFSDLMSKPEHTANSVSLNHYYSGFF